MSLANCSPSIKTILLLRNWAVSVAEGEKVEVDNISYADFAIQRGRKDREH
jgi:hypothetical protein